MIKLTETFDQGFLYTNGLSLQAYVVLYSCFVIYGEIYSEN